MRHTIIAFLLAALATQVSCNGAPPNVKDVGYTRMEHFIGGSNARDQIKAGVLADIAGAQTRVFVALSRLEDMEISQALVAAAARGVDVQVVSDTESASDMGMGMLMGNESILVTLGDGEIKYLPEPTLTSIFENCTRAANDLYIQCERRPSGDNTVAPDDGLMVRPDDFNRMTHNFFVIDDYTVWNFSSPMVANQNAYWFGWRAHSSDLVLAFAAEFRQMIGGTFAVDLDTYNGPNKSTVHGIVYDSRIPDHRKGRTRQLLPGYLTDDGMMKVRFNPQERLVKELLDEIYRARSSVFLVTDEVTNEFLVNALTYKAGAGFDVRVVVRSGSIIPDELRGLTNSLNGEPVVRQAPASIGYVPTFLVTNSVPDREQIFWPRVAMLITHPVWESAPFQVYNGRDLGLMTPDDVVRVFRSDLFADGSLWSFHEFMAPGQFSEEPQLRESAREQNEPAIVRRLQRFFLEEIWAQATAL